MKLPGLFGIRAISIALVLFTHLGASVVAPGVMNHRMKGVNIFFVLSGFLITYILCREEDKRGSISLKTFYAKRAIRIIPPLLPYLGALLILRSYGLIAVKSSDILYCLLFVRNVFPVPVFSGSIHTDHFWTLGVEEQFYLLWPVLLILLKTNRSRLNFGFVLLVFSPFWHVISTRLAGGPQYVNHVRFDMTYDPLLMGCCLALARREPRLLAYLQSPWLQGRWFPPAAIASLVAVLYVGRMDRVTYAIAALIINYAVEHEGGLLNCRPVVWLGKISYSLYIWQQLLCWGFSDHWLGRFPQNLIASLAIAVVSFHFIEQPFTRLRQRVRFVPRKRFPLRENGIPEAVPAAVASGD